VPATVDIVIAADFRLTLATAGTQRMVDVLDQVVVRQSFDASRVVLVKSAYPKLSPTIVMDAPKGSPPEKGVLPFVIERTGESKVKSVAKVKGD
jgi:hypothetical protein